MLLNCVKRSVKGGVDGRNAYCNSFDDGVMLESVSTRTKDVYTWTNSQRKICRSNVYLPCCSINVRLTT